MDVPIHTRRLSDKILWAFDQAIQWERAEVAAYLIQALELALTREGGANKVDRRKDMERVIEAYNRLRAAQG